MSISILILERTDLQPAIQEIAKESQQLSLAVFKREDLVRDLGIQRNPCKTHLTYLAGHLSSGQTLYWWLDVSVTTYYRHSAEKRRA